MPRVAVAPLAAIPDQGCLRVEVGGVAVGVWNDGGRVFALADRCPHAGAPLSDGHLEDGHAVCPWHGWCFRLTDGAWAQNPRIRTASYPAEVVGGTVYVEVPAPPALTGG